MKNETFDYSAIWQGSGLQIEDPWVHAKDLRILFPMATVHSLRRRFTWIKSQLGKQRGQPIHIAEIAHAYNMPLPHVVESIKQART